MWDGDSMSAFRALRPAEVADSTRRAGGSGCLFFEGPRRMADQRAKIDSATRAFRYRTSATCGSVEWIRAGRFSTPAS